MGNPIMSCHLIMSCHVISPSSLWLHEWTRAAAKLLLSRTAFIRSVLLSPANIRILLRYSRPSATWLSLIKLIGVNPGKVGGSRPPRFWAGVVVGGHTGG